MLSGWQRRKKYADKNHEAERCPSRGSGKCQAHTQGCSHQPRAHPAAQEQEDLRKTFSTRSNIPRAHTTQHVPVRSRAEPKRGPGPLWSGPARAGSACWWQHSLQVTPWCCCSRVWRLQDGAGAALCPSCNDTCPAWASPGQERGCSRPGWAHLLLPLVPALQSPADRGRRLRYCVLTENVRLWRQLDIYSWLLPLCFPRSG